MVNYIRKKKVQKEVFQNWEAQISFLEARIKLPKNKIDRKKCYSKNWRFWKLELTRNWQREVFLKKLRSKRLKYHFWNLQVIDMKFHIPICWSKEISQQFPEVWPLLLMIIWAQVDPSKQQNHCTDLINKS